MSTNKFEICLGCIAREKHWGYDVLARQYFGKVVLRWCLKCGAYRDHVDKWKGAK